MNYHIAGLNVQIATELDIPFMKDYICKNYVCPDIEITVSIKKSVELPKGKQYPHLSRADWLKKTNGEFCLYHVIKAYGIVISSAVTDAKAHRITVELIDAKSYGGMSAAEFLFYIIGETFQFVMPFHNRIVLHSSALSYNEAGIAFSAPSGTGKSTHTRLWTDNFSGCEIINDDTPVIRFDTKVPVICGSPWSGKTRLNRNISCPLKAVVFLEQAADNVITVPDAKQALALLLNETRRSPFPEREINKIQMLEKILKTVPVYKLQCNKELAAAKLSRERVFNL